MIYTLYFFFILLFDSLRKLSPFSLKRYIDDQNDENASQVYKKLSNYGFKPENPTI